MAQAPASPLHHSLSTPSRKPSRDVAAPVLLSDSAAKDVMLTWFRGEFAAANAIIDALCGHIVHELGGAGSDYEAVMAAIHRRRLNWIPVLQMQKYHSIGEVTAELQKATSKRLENVKEKTEREDRDCSGEKDIFSEKVDEAGGEEALDDDSPNSDITDSGSREEEQVEENGWRCSKHEKGCESRRGSSLIKTTKRFAAKEHVRGHRVNVVKGLKLYEDAFSSDELSKLLEFVNQLREAGRNQELSGDTYVVFNKNSKATKRELIQLGVPIFGNTRDEQEHAGNIEAMPEEIQSVIDQLMEWRVIPENKRPNGCVINFFDEEEQSQPFQKPPHVDQPISTLVLSHSTMVFGHKLGLDNDGNYRGSLTLSLNAGSVLVMRGNSAGMARHVTCPSDNKRVSITFFKLKPLPPTTGPTSSTDIPHTLSPIMTLPDLSLLALCPPPSSPLSLSPPNPNPSLRIPMPVVMLPTSPTTMSPGRGVDAAGGTGVFLPWKMPPRRSVKHHLPPRAQRLRLQSAAAAAAASASMGGDSTEIMASPEIQVK